MYRIIIAFFVILVITMFIIIIAEVEETSPENIVFKTKMGNVTFQHKQHIQRVANECSICHDTIFPKDATAPLNYKPHKAAEAAKSSCATCHVADGRAFESSGNCKKCHIQK